MYLAVLFALVISIDNIVVGISYGTRKIKISLLPNLLIGLITGLGTFISLICGRIFLSIISPQTAKFIGSFILIMFGLWIVYQEIQKLWTNISGKTPLPDYHHKPFQQQIGMIIKNPATADVDASGDISIKESIVLGLALAINNFTFGIGAGMIGVNPMLLAFDTVIISLITMYTGLKMGQHLSNHLHLGKWAGLVGGVVLLVTGIYDMFNSH